MTEPRWKNLVDKLLRLAAPDSGATEPERATARSKINQILENHPDAQAIREYRPVREFTLGDLRRMKRANISTDGHWEGDTLEGAIRTMVQDYARRLAQQRKLAAPVKRLDA